MMIKTEAFTLVHQDRNISHLEARPVGHLKRAMQLSEARLVAQLLDEIELAGALSIDRVFRGICLGSDGVVLGISIVRVSVEGGLRVERM